MKVTKFHQSYPYSGKATIEYTIGGTLPSNTVAEIILNTDDASATFIQKRIVTGANTNVIDFASSFGTMLLTNASFVVTIREAGEGEAEVNPDGVQLWENGPYWAECNVGATKPEEYGCHFWWGDTVGYTNTGSAWISVQDGTSGISFSSSGTAASTYLKDEAALRSEGYIDSTGTLVAAHDAATAHLGPSWRLPTEAEFIALKNNCDATWTTVNGVSGRLITGRGEYAHRSIFLPAAGVGQGANHSYSGDCGYYMSSTPLLDYSRYSWALYFWGSSDFDMSYDGSRYGGRTVRPVRASAQ